MDSINYDISGDGIKLDISWGCNYVEDIDILIKRLQAFRKEKLLQEIRGEIKSYLTIIHIFLAEGKTIFFDDKKILPGTIRLEDERFSIGVQKHIPFQFQYIFNIEHFEKENVEQWFKDNFYVEQTRREKLFE